MLNVQAKSLRGHPPPSANCHILVFFSLSATRNTNFGIGLPHDWFTLHLTPVCGVLLSSCSPDSCCRLQKEGGGDVMYFVVSYRVEAAHSTRQQMLNCKGLATITM